MIIKDNLSRNEGMEILMKYFDEREKDKSYIALQKIREGIREYMEETGFTKAGMKNYVTQIINEMPK